jgi:aspartyl-tRNA(Asn)/glutamyl-tRNA(Gln) amidotransferase subunit C
MTKLSLKDVQYLATLSNLKLSDQEAESLTEDLGRIVGYIEQLSELDTEGVEPTYEVTGLENIWREDEVRASGVTKEQLLALAPHSQQDQIKVPKVL